MKIINHRLHRDDGTPYAFRESPHVGEVIKPRWLVMHYTASGSASEAISWFANKASRVSAHIVIAKDGTITQCVPFNRRANHAGVSAWKGVNGLNKASIGIELDGFGFLFGEPGKWTFRDRPVADDQVLVATHKGEKKPRGWARYPQAQLDAARELARLLVRQYALEDVVGHEDISPGRKQDPGPAFPMEAFRAHAMADDAAPVDAAKPAASVRPIARFRVAQTLNVRSGPGAASARVPGGPLPPGSIVRGVEDRDGWTRVTAEGSGMAGWVSAQFLEPIPAELFTVTVETLNVRGGAGSAHATVSGSPLRKDAIVQELEEGDGWKRVVSLAAPQLTGWVSTQFLKPAVIAMSDVGQPANA